MTRARASYRRFVGYWKDGDLDRERVAEAQQKLAGGYGKARPGEPRD
jgi:hypothetical protein